MIDREELDSRILRKPLEDISMEELDEKKIVVKFDIDEEDYKLQIHPS